MSDMRNEDGRSQRGDETYREYAPPPGLDAHVACLWVRQAAADGCRQSHLTVPNGSAEIVCDLDTAAIHAVGPHTIPRRCDLPAGRTIVGVRFRPGAVQAMIGLPAPEIVDSQVDLADCWPPSRAGLGESMAESGSVPRALARLTQDLLHRAGPAPRAGLHAGAVVEWLQPWSRCTVKRLSQELYISERHLRRRCLAVFGHAPKELQRILRFQALLALVQGRACDEVPLAGLALVAGYADQAHMTRECSRLTGLTPTRFLAELSVSCGSNHDHAISFARARRLLSHPPHPKARDVRFLQDPGGEPPYRRACSRPG